jgi:hypothetical protein
MEQKTITITIDAQGNSTLDLNGFAGKGCDKVFEDFRGGDMVKLEQKKPDYFAGHQVEQERVRR